MLTPSDAVREQIDAVKEYLIAAGFTEVEEPLIQEQVVQHRHTIVMRYGERKTLYLDYGWLRDHDAAALRDALDDKRIADKLQNETPFLEIGHDGTVRHDTDYR
jgi:hypothetical protein